MVANMIDYGILQLDAFYGSGQVDALPSLLLMRGVYDSWFMLAMHCFYTIVMHVNRYISSAFADCLVPRGITFYRFLGFSRNAVLRGMNSYNILKYEYPLT